MSGFLSFRRVVTCSILAAAVAGGGFLFAQASPPATAPSVMPPAESSIATINGKDINSKFFYDTLMEIDGVRVFEKVRDLALVQSECETNGIAVGDQRETEAQKADFQKRFKDEFNKAYESLGVSGLPAGTVLDDQKKLEIVNSVLQQRGINPIEFKMTLEARAGLRSLAQGKVNVSEDDIKDEYNAEYGEKLHIRVFPVTDDVAKQAEIRSAVEKDKNPDKAAEDLKLPKPGTGVIPRSIKDKSPLVQASLLLKVGELSPATELPPQNGQPAQKGMIYLESVDPDKTAATLLTSKLHDEIKQKVFDAKQELWMNNHLIMARANATIKINDPILLQEYQNIAAAIQAQAAAAASQPGGAGTTITPATNTAPPGPGPMPGGNDIPLPKIPTTPPPSR